MGVCAAGGVDTVAEDEASSASTDSGVWVASTCPVIHGPPAVGLQVGAVDGDDFADYCPDSISILVSPLKTLEYVSSQSLCLNWVKRP
jgi:hypothetical protein